MAALADVPNVVIKSISYDGPSIFLQGQNGVAMKVEGKVCSPIRLHQVSFDIRVVGTFTGSPRRSAVEMSLKGEPFLSLIPFDDVAGEFNYKFSGTLLSNFSSPHSGDCLLTASFVFGPFMTVDNVELRSVPVISHGDQDNNRARRIGRHVRPPSDFTDGERIGDQGPGIETGPAVESSFLRDPPVFVPDVREQGYGEYIGPGEDADWQNRLPSPVPSTPTTVSDMSDISIPDTEIPESNRTESTNPNTTNVSDLDDPDRSFGIDEGFDVEMEDAW